MPAKGPWRFHVPSPALLRAQQTAQVAPWQLEWPQPSPGGREAINPPGSGWQRDRSTRRDGRQLQRGTDGGSTAEVHGVPAPALHPPRAQEPPAAGGAGGGGPRGGQRHLPPAGAAPQRVTRRDGVENDHPRAGRRRDPAAPRHEQEGKDRDVRGAGWAQRLRHRGVRLQQAAGGLQVLASPRLLHHPRGRGQLPGAGRCHRDLPAPAG